ncbi:MFS general substrate transporter [Amylocystis lapponica]|nr:MFS general substrate transporter [Amylocystis lapponica]
MSPPSEPHHIFAVADDLEEASIETDPLLVSRAPESSARVVTPLPKLQLGVIFAIKLILPITVSQVLPYLNVLVAELAKSEGAQTGYYSGLVGSASGIAHLFVIYGWGRLSDKHGRIPVIVIGNLGIALFTLLFGLSRSFATVLFTRFFVGVFSGITGAIHSVVGELTDATNQSAAFPYYDIVAAVGYVVGPLIGGTFANPATQFPVLFDSPFWHAYPYLLPCLITSGGALVAALLAVFVLEETLPRKRSAQKVTDDVFPYGETVSDTNHERDVPSTAAKPLSIKALASMPVIRAVCASSAALGFVGSAFNNGFVLLAYTPIDGGGLSLTPPEIGRALSIMGTVSIFLKLLMPMLLRKLGVLTVFRICMQSWPVTFASMSLLSLVAKSAAGAEGKALEWTAVGIVLFLSRIGCMAFSIIMILTKDHTPGTTSLGTANGMAEFAQSFTAAITPTIFGSLFAFSVTRNILGGYLWAIVVVLITLLGGSFAESMRKYRDD